MANLDSILGASGDRRLFLKGLGAFGGSVLIGCADQERNLFGYQDISKPTKGVENGIRYVSFADSSREYRLYENASEFEVHEFKSNLSPYISRAAKPAIIQPGSSYGLRSIDERVAKPADSSDISWMPYMKCDWSRNRTVDFDDFFLFVDYFGSSNPEYDLDGNGKVDFNDFFLFVDGFGKSQSGFEVALAPLLTGQLEVSHPSSPGLRYLLPNNTGMGRVVVSDGNPIVTNLDVSDKYYGKFVEVEALGFDNANDPVRGGRGVTRMPNYYLSVELNDKMKDANGYYQLVLNLPSKLPPDLFCYGESANNLGNFLALFKNPRVSVGSPFNDPDASFSTEDGRSLSMVVYDEPGKYIRVTNVEDLRGVVKPGSNPLEIRARGGADLKRFIVSDTYGLKP